MRRPASIQSSTVVLTVRINLEMAEQITWLTTCGVVPAKRSDVAREALRRGLASMMREASTPKAPRKPRKARKAVKS